jgi:hypothetical protein
MLHDYVGYMLTKFKRQKYESNNKDSYSIHMRIRRNQLKRRIQGKINDEKKD